MKINIITKVKKIIIVSNKSKKNERALILATKPYPGFPTDLQAQIMVLMLQEQLVYQQLKKISLKIVLCMFLNLRRMGASIEIKGNKARIFGGKKLKWSRAHGYRP